jgi:hemoglobin-like flavoprotein
MRKSNIDVVELSSEEVKVIDECKRYLTPSNADSVVENLLAKFEHLEDAFSTVGNAKQGAFLINMFKRGVKLAVKKEFDQIYDIWSRHPKYGVSVEHVVFANECIADILVNCIKEDDSPPPYSLEQVISTWKHLMHDILEKLMISAYNRPDEKKTQKYRQRIYRMITFEDIENVLGAWNQLKEVKVKVGGILGQLLVKKKSIAKVFHSHKIDVIQQAHIIFDMLDQVMIQLSDIDTLIPFLKTLGVKHSNMGVGGKTLALMKPLLLELFEKSLGFSYTNELRQSWERISSFIIGMMISGGRENDNQSGSMVSGSDVMSTAKFGEITPKDIETVQNSWDRLDKIIEKASISFYKDLLGSTTEVRQLFSKTDMQSQATKLVRAIGSTVSLLTDMDSLVPILEELGRRHVYYNVYPKYFKYVKRAWFNMLKFGLGLRWTNECEKSWERAWALIAGVMKTSLADAWLLYTPPETEKINLKVLVNHLDRIETQDMSFYADVWFAAYTNDNPSQSAAFNTENTDGDDTTCIDPIERPDWNLVALNAMEVENVYKKNRERWLKKLDDGKWYMRGQFRGTFAQPFDLHNFPLDHHVLTFQFALEVDDGVAKFNEENLTIRLMPFKLEQMCGANWEVGTPSIKLHSDSAIMGGSLSGKKYTHCVVEIPISRRWKSHIWETFGPLLLIEITAFAVYFCDITPQIKRFGVIVTLLLTLFAFKMTASENMPPTPYLTLMDHFFNIAKAELLIHMIVNVIIATFDIDGEIGLNETFLEILFIAFGVVHIFLFWKIKRLNDAFPKYDKDQDVMKKLRKAAASRMTSNMTSIKSEMSNMSDDDY